jgi:predicted transcriptional regulator
MELTKWKPQKVLALEYLIDNPTASQRDVALEAGVSQSTVSNWYKDPGFVETFYDKYMIVYNSKLPKVLDAMVNEAIEGNVQAGRLVLEHSGKLQKNIVIKHESPFERFLKNTEIQGEYEEIFEEDVIKETPKIPTFTEQPLRVMSSPKEKALQKRKEAYQLKKRANKVGLPLLPVGRTSPNVKREWIEKLEEMEKDIDKIV